MAAELLSKGLPSPWSFGVTRDGRIFFIDDVNRVTTWLHPTTGQPVCTGHNSSSDLPQYWEHDTTNMGIPYYIDHSRQETTFVHPLSREATYTEDIHSPESDSRLNSPRHLSSIQSSPSIMETRRSMRKKNNGNHSSPHIIRSSQAPVTMEGWLYKQDSKGLRQWKKRWFVLSDYCLFYYKAPGCDQNLGSILLPSYKINPCTSDDKVSRKNAFKAEHANMRTYYFCAETKESMSQWMNCMSLATILQKHSSVNNLPRGNEERQSYRRSRHDGEDPRYTYQPRRSSRIIDENSTLNSSMMSDSIPRETFSSNGMTSGFESGNYPPYDPRMKTPVNDIHSLGPGKTEHLYVNAPPKPLRFQYDESCNELPSDENLQSYYHQQNPDDLYRRQLRSKADSIFSDGHHRYPYPRNDFHQNYDDQRSYNYHDKTVLSNMYNNHMSTGSSDCGYRSHGSTNSPRTAPPLPKKGVSHPHENNNSIHMSPPHFDEIRKGAQSYNQMIHTPERTEYTPRPPNQNYRDDRYDNYCNDRPSQLIRENYGRASTRSLGAAASRVRPTSSYQTQENRDRPMKQLTRDDSFTVNMEKENKNKAEQREASMKRLLEWKQRMLQSPLSRNHRKPIESTTIEMPPDRPPLPDGYHEQVLQDLVKHENAALRTINEPNNSFATQHATWQNKRPSQVMNQEIAIPIQNELTPSKSRDRSRSSNRLKEEKNSLIKVGRPPSRTQDRRASSLNRFKDTYSSEDDDEPDRNRRNHRRPTPQGQTSHKPKLSQPKSDYINVSNDTYNRYHDYLPNHTYEIGQEGPLKEELNYAQELLHQKYENRLKSVTSKSPITSQPITSRDYPSYNIPPSEYFPQHTDRSYLYQQESINLYEKSDSDLYMGTEPAVMKKMVSKQLFYDHENRNVDSPLGVEPLTISANQNGLSGKLNTDNKNVLPESLPSPEYHHLQHKTDDNVAVSHSRPQNWYGLSNDNSVNQFHNLGLPDPSHDGHSFEPSASRWTSEPLHSFQHNYTKHEPFHNTPPLPEAAKCDSPQHGRGSMLSVSKVSNGYENVSNTSATSLYEPKNDFSMEYKSKFGQETASKSKVGLSEHSAPECDYQHQDNGLDGSYVCLQAIEKNDNMMKFSDSIMYKLANDASLQKDGLQTMSLTHSAMKGFLNESMSPKNQTSGPEIYDLKPNISVEELRNSIKKVKEAPPANIVQKRIKHFEVAKESPEPQPVTEEREVSSKKTSPRRRFYSDSEAVLYGNSSSESDVEGDLKPEAEKPANVEQHYLAMQPIGLPVGHSEPVYMQMNQTPTLKSIESQHNIPLLASSQTHARENSNVSHSSYKYPIDIKPPRHFRDSSQYSETDSKMSYQSAESGYKLHADNVQELHSEPSGYSASNEPNLPDLLKHEEGEESVISDVRNCDDSNQSSDADDEASKDFDSVPVKKQFQTKLNFWYNKDRSENDDGDTDSEKDSIPSYLPPPPPMTASSIPIKSGLKDYYEQQLNGGDLKAAEHNYEQALERQPPTGESASPGSSAYSQYRMYEDDRRSTQFLVKPSADDKQSKLLVKKIRIYNEGKPAENMKAYTPTHSVENNDIDGDEGGHYVGLRAPDSTPVVSAAQPSTSSSPAADDESNKDKSPNSAPYYYSDLLKDDSQVPDINRSSPRLITRPVPNNIRSLSPPNAVQPDIGRRVNLIHQEEVDHLNAEVENNLRYPTQNQSEITPEIRCSLEQILGSESKKFSDLERNRYEAGNTLEKTRHLDNNRIKLRSATPDFDLSTSRQALTDDFPRSLALQNHNLLSRRMSRSMEDLLDTSTVSSPPIIVQDLRRHVVTKPPPPIPPPKPNRSREPYYENSAHLKRMSNLDISQSEHDSSLARRGLPVLSSHEARPQAYPAKHSISSDNFIDGPSSQLPIVNGSSTQSFLGLCQPNPDTGPSMPMNESRLHFLGVGPKTDFKGGGCEATSDAMIESEVAILTSAPHFSSHSSCSSLDPAEQPRADGEEASHSKAAAGGRKRHKHKKKQSIKEDSNMSDSEIHINASSKLRRLVRQSEGLSNKGKRLSISAGELLGKTHEELVLLLIQLRRNQAKILKARDQCRKQLDNLKSTLDSNDILLLQQQFNELNNQSEATRPLINLVDNMVKLGSLYGGSDQMLASQYRVDDVKDYMPPKAMIEFSRKMQEKRLVQGSREELNNMTPEEVDLEEKLELLFRLDRELQEESSALANLQHDRDILDKTLEGVKKKVSDASNEMEKERLKKQQKLIEKELSRVKSALTDSVKKLEDKTTENSRVEHEILILRQKIHQSLMRASTVKSSSSSASKIEAELNRVQAMLDELADRRKELCNAVNMFKVSSSLVDVRASPTGIAGSAALPGKKKPCTTYLETDMDTCITVDVGTSVSPQCEPSCKVGPPIYVNTDTDKQTLYEPQDINDADDKMKRFYGIIPKEKPCEIKTVRIVKREAGRRNKDKKRVTYDDSSLVQVIEDQHIYDDQQAEEEPGQLTRSLTLPRNFSSRYNQARSDQALSAHQRLFGNVSAKEMTSPVKAKPPEVIKKVGINRKPKRRHHTVIGSSQTASNAITIPQSRSRDDLDMEHCLRTVNTPDVVKSTIKKGDVFDGETIDRELGLPDKILIPERYIECEPEPQLSVAEQLQRSQKAASIRKMLSESAQYDDMVSDPQDICRPTETLKKKMDEERKKREQLLALNQAIAKEVMQKSKFVAGSVTPSPDSE